ncbi:MAG: nitrilase-related carbon-nitrogen hydrolase [Planctomycetota bacterium]
MRAHLLQLDLAWEDRGANFALVERAIDDAAPDEGDLLVLPELFDSGFSLNTDATADRSGATLSFLLRLAEDLGVTVQGSRTVRDCHCEKAQNRATVAGPTQGSNHDDTGATLLADYAKVHPFSFGREPERFEGGSDVAVYRWHGPQDALTVCPVVCYDLRFPELFRAGVDRGAEAFACGANWPAERQSHWRALTVARAIENQAFVLAVNRVGSDPYLSYAGGTIAVGPRGEVLGELDDRAGVLSVEIDPARVRSWREEFPVLRDRRLRGDSSPR